MVVWRYRQSGHTTPDQTGDTMSHYGTGYDTAETSVRTDQLGHSTAGRTPVVSFVNVSKHYGSL